MNAPVSDDDDDQPRFMLLLHVNDADKLEVASVDGTDGPDDVSADFFDLVHDWIELEAIDGELHPYLDDALLMLFRLNEAQRAIVNAIEKGDPYVASFNTVLDTMDMLLRQIMQRLEDGPDQDLVPALE